MSRTITATRHLTHTCRRVRAPTLAPLLDVMLALAADPFDRRARIQRGLLTHSGADLCPSCGVQLELSGYRETRTSFCQTRTLACRGCSIELVVSEQTIA